MKKKKKFLWGVTHIGSQTESDCHTSDWHQAISAKKMPPIGCGIEYLERFSEHHRSAEDLGCNALRITLEWARIEPRDDEFDREAIRQYRKVLMDLRARNIKTVVGLFHYVSPLWFSENYGWHHAKAQKFFTRYVQRVSQELGDTIDVLIVHNEPMLYVSLGYIRGSRPPFKKNIFFALSTFYNICRSQHSVYKIWKKAHPKTLIGSAHLCNAITSSRESFLDRTVGFVLEKISYIYRIGLIIACTKKASDYIGINYYSANSFYIGRNERTGKWHWGIHGKNDWHDPLVWQSFAHGFERTLQIMAGYKKPLFILENGKPSLPGVDDDDRHVFLTEHTDLILKYRDTYDIRGYFHHSLYDCYEWDSGYDFKFGLIDVVREDLTCTRRKSYTTYQDIISHDKVVK